MAHPVHALRLAGRIFGFCFVIVFVSLAANMKKERVSESERRVGMYSLNFLNRSSRSNIPRETEYKF